MSARIQLRTKRQALDLLEACMAGSPFNRKRILRLKHLVLKRLLRQRLIDSSTATMLSG